MKKEYVWQKQSMASDFETIDCLSYDPIKDFHLDPTGYYVLIRVNQAQALIEVAICNKKHEIIKAFRGKTPQDLYYAIFEYEKKHRCEWFSRKDHIAYLGKELNKAKDALARNTIYCQE